MIPHNSAHLLLKIHANTSLLTAGSEEQLKNAFGAPSPDEIVQNAQRRVKGSHRRLEVESIGPAATKGNADMKTKSINSVAVANLASDVESIDLDEEQEDANAQQAARVTHTKRKTLEEIKSLVGEDEGSVVSFVIVG